MAYIILDVCPRCKTDISRRLGLITTKMINCPKCGHEMLVTESAVLNSWQYNVTFGAWLVFWGILAIYVFTSPEVAEFLRWKFQLRVVSWEHLLMAALVAAVPAAFIGAVIGLFGRMTGYFVAQGLTQEAPPAPARGGWPQQRQAFDAPRMEGNGCLVRALAGMLWFVVFLFGGIVGASLVATSRAGGNEKLIKELNEQVARDWTGWILLGSFVSALALTFWGVLPGTKRLREVTDAGRDPEQPYAPPEPERGCLIRSLFGCGWFGALFFGSVFVLALVVTGMEGNKPRPGQQLDQEWIGWLFLGSLGLTLALTIWGVLPGTGRRKR